jgi:hypothetical protein
MTYINPFQFICQFSRLLYVEEASVFVAQVAWHQNRRLKDKHDFGIFFPVPLSSLNLCPANLKTIRIHIRQFLSAFNNSQALAAHLHEDAGHDDGASDPNQPH